MVIRNAIQIVLGIDNEFARDTECEFHLQASRYRIDELRESFAILDLAEVDRLVFVICVLERLSILDCALLLRKSPKEVNDAIMRATHQIASVADRNHTETSRYRVDGDALPPGGASISRADVANFMFDQIASREWLRKGVYICGD